MLACFVINTQAKTSVFWRTTCNVRRTTDDARRFADDRQPRTDD